MNYNAVCYVMKCDDIHGCDGGIISYNINFDPIYEYYGEGFAAFSEYDKNGNLIRSKLVDYNEIIDDTRYEYDENNNLIHVIGINFEDGYLKIIYFSDQRGHMWIDEKNNLSVTERDAYHRITRELHDGIEYTFTYDDSGNIISTKVKSSKIDKVLEGVFDIFKRG